MTKKTLMNNIKYLLGIHYKESKYNATIRTELKYQLYYKHLMTTKTQKSANNITQMWDQHIYDINIRSSDVKLLQITTKSNIKENLYKKA